MITLSFPFPPSANTYFRSVPIGNKLTKVIISKKGREYIEKVSCIVASKEIVTQTERLFARYDLYPPDRRSRDIDNFDSKAINDALTKAGVVEDDKLIRGKISWFHDDNIVKGGKIVVQLVPLDDVREIYETTSIY